MSVFILRSVSACALPLPSAIASAKFANSTVNHSQNAIPTRNTTWLGRSAGPVARTINSAST